MTESDGYRLDVDAGDVDADRFEALVAEARALNDTDTARAVALLEEAEDLGEGRRSASWPLADGPTPSGSRKLGRSDRSG